MLLQDYQVVKDKQLYQLTPRSKWKMQWRYWKCQSQNVQKCGYVYQNTNGRNYGPPWKTQSFLLSEICTVILWQDCYGKGHPLLLSVYVDDIKLAWKKPYIDPMWKLLNKVVDLWEPTSFRDHVNLGCTQRQCEISKDIIDNYWTMFESRISAGATEKLPCSEIFIFLRGPTIW